MPKKPTGRNEKEPKPEKPLTPRQRIKAAIEKFNLEKRLLKEAEKRDKDGQKAIDGAIKTMLADPSFNVEVYTAERDALFLSLLPLVALPEVRHAEKVEKRPKATRKR